ncbi:MAG: peptide ABC transporter substrate-binding protein, partial [Chlamydiae bacterium]|nr:peptide ABC transporter substrate-binding protein [Chlamydiota bacterium]
SLSQSKDYHHYSMSGTYYYIFNTKEYPFTNVHIRRAFCYAIHREDIVKNLLQGNQTPATGLIPPSMCDITPHFQDADIVLAQKEFAIGLKELGISKDKFPAIKLSYNTNSGHHKIAQAVQEQWSQVLGVNVYLENMEWKVFLDTIRTHTFQVARMGGIASFNDPITFLSAYQHETSSLNQCQWSDPEFSRLIELSENEKDKNKRMSYLLDAEKIFIDQMPIAPIYFYSGSYMQKPYLKKVNISDLSDIDFKYSYLESK